MKLTKKLLRYIIKVFLMIYIFIYNKYKLIIII